MKICCGSPADVGMLVRRCAVQQKKNGSCYECLLYPFCVPEHDYENRRQVEDLCSVDPGYDPLNLRVPSLANFERVMCSGTMQPVNHKNNIEKEETEDDCRGTGKAGECSGGQKDRA